MPKVSVVMAVYNGERYLWQAVESILTQTLADFEFIIVDDGSTDSTPQILENIRDPRVKVLRQENSGRARALNMGIQLAQSAYIARMDADDIALKARLERQVEFLDRHPRVGLVGTAAYMIDSQGRILAQWLPPADDKTIRRVLIKRNPFMHPSTMMRKVAVEGAGYYDPAFIASDDYDLWFRIARKYEMANLSEPLLMWRIHAGSITFSRQHRTLREALRIILREVREGTYPPYSLIYMGRHVFMWLLPLPINHVVRRFWRRNKVVVVR